MDTRLGSQRLLRHQHRSVGVVARLPARLPCRGRRTWAVQSFKAEQGPDKAQQQQAKPQGRGRVVAIGESLFDYIADQKGLPRDKVKSWTPFAGGAPANVATSLAKLGMDVVFVTALGRDAPGDSLYALLKDSGVKLTAVQRKEEPTRDIYVVRDDKGDREFAGFGRPSDEYCDAHIDETQLPLDDIKGAAVLVTGTLGLAFPDTRKALYKAVETARQGGCKVLVDVNWRPVFWEGKDEAKQVILDFLRHADVIKLSDADLVLLDDITGTTALINPCVVAERFPNAQAVLVTAGSEGAAYCVRAANKTSHSGFVPIFKLDVVDTTGAGDAFTAGFLYKMLQAGGLEGLVSDPVKLKEAVVYGSAAGALTCTKKGGIDGQPTLDEVMKLSEQTKSWHNFWQGASAPEQ